ncbi:hypothetical protein B0H11DRAFT_1994435 [Mycena galericulata]|nr:hypothetical protein B0H11DRAFT_1994435 [Mycena galericulata]
MLAVNVIGLVALFQAAVAQTTHTVMVGVEGSFFSPPTLSAGLNDTVTFVFGGDFHSVTQSTFTSPCVRLADGFDSGLAGRGATFSNPPAVWNLRITNASETIWYFCQASMPTSHCESGMVGAINPPSIPMYDQFVSAAKLVTFTPTPSPSFIASGQGAFATNSPMPSSSNLSSAPALPSSSPSPSSSSSSASSPTSSLTPTLTSHSGTNRGLIAGCASAGGLIVLILLVLAVVHCRRWKTRRGSTLSDRDSMLRHEKTRGLTAASTAGTSSRSGATHVFPTMSASPTVGLYDADISYPSEVDPGDTSPTRAIRPLPRTPSHDRLRRAQSHGRAQGADVHENDPRTQHIDIDALAMEVASVLLHTPPRPGSRGHQQQLNALRSHTRFDSGSSGGSAVSPPPHYRPS